MAVAAITVAAGSAPAPAIAGGPARVTGSAEFRLTFAPDDDVRRFAFDARATPYTHPLPGLPGGLPSDATGTVRVLHRVAASGVTVTFEAAVDCLITAPGYAAMTAVVTRADEPVRDWVGRRVGFSVQDAGPGGRRDRVGFDWSLSADQDENGDWGRARVGTCLAPAPFAPVTRGDLTVRHADLRP
ncbi:hypothetical protein Asi03nite_07250 [Actinoplanes siamensis]|uniref:Uncharacterized protein n=1 Tax=Actinoplanes siamensis TaxID=1223317 RepID=A0A919K8Y4_9ACTN|nr:hypothetical protein Asi03nite_07250 [Actinoplanes siamensis]